MIGAFKFDLNKVGSQWLTSNCHFVSNYKCCRCLPFCYFVSWCITMSYVLVEIVNFFTFTHILQALCAAKLNVFSQKFCLSDIVTDFENKNCCPVYC